MISETKKRVRRSPLHSKIESEFVENHVIPTLEIRKQTLAEIRNFHQPIRLAQIRVHSEQKKDQLKEKLKEFFKKREFYAQCNADVSDKYNSKFWKVVSQREKEQKAQEQMAREEIVNREKKKIAYAKNVLAIYKPKVSKKKKVCDKN